MKIKLSDMKADISSSIDRNENPSMMDPLLISQNSPYRKELTDLALELVAKSAGFKRSLPAAVQSSLADMVRSMNCYYSNLIEGHYTHPVDIEKALKGNYSSDVKKRNLQKEAKAHITIQKWIDSGGVRENPFAKDIICEIHKRFYELLPEDLICVVDPDTGNKVKVIAGEFRECDVKIGTHVAVSPGSITRFLDRFTLVYSALGKMESILALPAAHHRLLWIHPFADGNGRVARLMSHAVTLNVLDTGGLWSIARGLARNNEKYKMHLANCDLLKRNDLDGRGNLSEEALVEFTKFFLGTCIDQIEFMEKVMQPDLLRTRILLWAREEIELNRLVPHSKQILEAILYRGEISRGEITSLLNMTDRHARRLTADLIEKGILFSDSPRGNLKLAFPAKFAHRWMPGLFPELG